MMQTMYYATSNYIRHTGNLVDLNEYRRRQAIAQEGSLAPQLDAAVEAEPAPAQEVTLTLLPAERPRRRSRCEGSAWVLDVCASLCVVVMTLAFTLQVFL